MLKEITMTGADASREGVSLQTYGVVAMGVGLASAAIALVVAPEIAKDVAELARSGASAEVTQLLGKGAEGLAMLTVKMHEAGISGADMGEYLKVVATQAGDTAKTAVYLTGGALTAAAEVVGAVLWKAGESHKGGQVAEKTPMRRVRGDRSQSQIF